MTLHKINAAPCIKVRFDERCVAALVTTTDVLSGPSPLASTIREVKMLRPIYLPEAFARSLDSDLTDNTGYLLEEDDVLGAVWWRVDTRTGELLSRGGSGEGIAGHVVFFGVLLFTLIATCHGIRCAAAGGSLGSCLATVAEQILITAGLVSIEVATAIYAPAAGVAAGVALASRLLIALVGQLLMAIYENLRDPVIEWFSDPPPDDTEKDPDPPAPMCVDLSSIVPSGSAGSIGTDGGLWTELRSTPISRRYRFLCS